MSTMTAALQVSTTAAADAPAAAAPVMAGAENAAGEDFILALTQALSSAAPAVMAPVTPAITQVVATSEPALDTETLIDDEAAAAQLANMLVLPWVPQQPVAMPVATATDPLELLGVTPSQLLPAAKLPSGLETASADALAASATANPDALTLPATALLESSALERAPAPDTAPIVPLAERPLSTSSPASEAAAARPVVHTHVGTQGWSDEVGTRLTLMAERGQQSASLRLSPEHLGPLEIRIAIRDDQASVWFGAAHADTRAAIEQALPRLRELFAAQGMTLTDAGVSREPPRQQLPNPQQPGRPGEPAADAPLTMRTQTLQRIGLIDAYA